MVYPLLVNVVTYHVVLKLSYLVVASWLVSNSISPLTGGFNHCVLLKCTMPYFSTRNINIVDHEINVDDLTPIHYEYETYEARDRNDFDELLELLGF